MIIPTVNVKTQIRCRKQNEGQCPRSEISLSSKYYTIASFLQNAIKPSNPRPTKSMA